MKHASDDFELSIVKAKPLNNAPRLKTFPKIKPRALPTSSDAIEALRATRGVDAILGHLPSLLDPALLPQVAHWSPVSASGLAAGEPIFWGVDFISDTYDVQMAYSERYIYFAGHEFLGEVQKPNTLDGRVWCEMNDQTSSGIYLFLAQFESYTDDLFSPGYVSIINFSINDQFIGARAVYPGSAPAYPFLLDLPSGMNRFEITQSLGAMFFQSLTAFRLMQTQA